MAEVQETTINNLKIRHFMIDHIDHGFEENFEINFGTPNMLCYLEDTNHYVLKVQTYQVIDSHHKHASWGLNQSQSQYR